VQRVFVVGGPGSGKSTLARHTAAATGAEYVELDAPWWQADWVPSDSIEFASRTRDRLEDAVGWVVDGNYLDQVGVTELWPAADTILWLDLPRWIAFRRLVQRSGRRVFMRQSLWNGNREQLSVLRPRSLLQLWDDWPGYGDRIGLLLQEPMFTHLVVFRLRTPRDVRRFLRNLPRQRQTRAPLRWMMPRD
jgi:adenylate kinase family enzyme